MIEKDLDLLLLSGLPIKIEGVGSIYPPRIKDVVDLGESIYNQFISALLFDKNNFEGLTDQHEFSNFQVMFSYCYHDTNFREIVMNSIDFLFKEKAHLGHDDSDVFFYFGDISEKRIINSSKMDEIQLILKKMNFIKTNNEPEYNPANTKAKQMIDLILKNKKNAPKQKETMNLHSIISGMAWKSRDISILNIFDLTIYQLYQGFKVLENIDNYHNTLTGIYSGTLNSKEINLSKLHWAKIVENN